MKSGESLNGNLGEFQLFYDLSCTFAVVVGRRRGAFKWEPVETTSVSEVWLAWCSIDPPDALAIFVLGEMKGNSAVKVKYNNKKLNKYK